MMLFRVVAGLTALLLGVAVFDDGAKAAPAFNDLICETTATTGTGTLDLGGAVTGGYVPFVATIPSGSTVPYTITNGAGAARKFESGWGTFTDGTPDTLTRTPSITSDDQTPAITALTLAGTSTVCLSNSASSRQYLYQNLDLNSFSIGGAGAINITGALTASTNVTATGGDLTSGDDVLVGDDIDFGSGDVQIAYAANDLSFTGVTGDYSFDDTVGVTGDVTATALVQGADLNATDDLTVTDDATVTGNLFVNTTDGAVSIGDTALSGKSATTDFGIEFFDTSWVARSGITTEVQGEIFSLGSNVYQLGGRDTTNAGGIFRFDTRDTNREFIVIAQRPGDSGTTEVNAFRVSLDTGVAAAFEGVVGMPSVELGSTIAAPVTDTTVARSSAGNISVEGNVVYRAGGTDVAVADGGTGASSLTDLITLNTHTTGVYVAQVADGTGVDGTANAEAATYTPSLDLTELNSFTLGVGSATGIIFDAGASDPAIEVASGSMTIDIGGTNETVLNATNFTPGANDGNALGASGTAWADLFLASGGLIEFDGGTTNTLICSGGNCTIEGNGIYRAGGTDVAVADGGTGASALTDLIALTTHTTGNYVQQVADGTGIDGSVNSEGGTYTPTFDATEITTVTWGVNNFTTEVFSTDGVDLTWDYTTTDAVATLSGGGTTPGVALDDQGFLRFLEEDAGGANYKAFAPPAAITADTTCTFEDDANFIPDSCVGNGTDDTGAPVEGTAIDVSGSTVSWDPTEVNSVTWGAGSFTTEIFDAGATDPTWTYGSNTATLTNANTLAMTSNTQQIDIGTTAGGSSATPVQMNFGSSFADAAVGSKAKWIMWDSVTSSQIYGIGISSARFNFFTDSTATYNWLFGDADEIRLSTTNFFPVTNDGNALGASGTAWADLWLAAGGLVEFDGGTTNTFTCTGGNCSIEGNSMYRSGSDLLVADGTGVVLGHSAQLATWNTTGDAGGDVTPEFQMLGTGAADSYFGVSRWNAAATGPFVQLGKSRGATIGDYTVVADGDVLGLIGFLGADGTDFAQAATIQAEVDGTPGNDDMPGRIVFRTTADASNAPAVRGTIKNDGGWIIGSSSTITSPGANNLRLYSAADTANGPVLSIVLDDPSPDADDTVGYIDFYGDTSTGSQVTGGQMYVTFSDVTNGSTDSYYSFANQVAGSTTTNFRIGNGVVVGGGTTFPGLGGLALQSSTVGPLRFYEATGTGSNYIGFIAPSSITSDVTCTLENDGNPIPDSCVGDGSDAGGSVTIATETEYWTGTDTTKPLGVKETWDAAAQVAKTETAGAIAMDLNTGINFAVTIDEASTLSNPTNEKIGQTGLIEVTASGGARTLALGSQWLTVSGVEPFPLTIPSGESAYISYWVDATDVVRVTGVFRTGGAAGTITRTAGRQTIPLLNGVYPVGGAVATCSSLAAVDSGSNDIFTRQCSFSASADNAIYYTFIFPKGSSPTTDLVVQLDWTSTTTTDATDDVIWTASAVCFSNDDPINGNAFPTVDTITDTQTAAGDYLVTPEITAITPAGSPAKGDGCVLRITRDADNASDNFNGTADLILTRLYMVDDAANDD